jgi:endoribonuclease L-PSP, putative
MEKEIIATNNAPAALGPYSQAVCAGNMVFLSGQLGIDPATGELGVDVVEQAHQAMKNILAVLKEKNATADNIVKTTIFLSDLGNFATVNDIYKTYFTGSFPARSCVEIAALPKNAAVEIEAIAYLG